MVLNEPETSLHRDLLPALARLIVTASGQTQIWVVSHSRDLIDELTSHRGCHSIRLVRKLGATRLEGQRRLDQQAWVWP